jgi:hypothetical protein
VEYDSSIARPRPRAQHRTQHSLELYGKNSDLLDD